MSTAAKSRPTPPSVEAWSTLLDLALAEDLGPADLTSELTVEADREGRARIEARQSLVVCGLDLAREVFRRVDPDLVVAIESGVRDGQLAEPGQALFRVSGRYASILAAERTALNFMGRLCGIATQTRRLVDLVTDTPTDLVDTRKTTPGWRPRTSRAVAILSLIHI